MKSGDEAIIRVVLLDRDDAYAQLDDLADQLVAVELENRELRKQLDTLGGGDARMSPIRASELARYPADWREISAGIRDGRAAGQCECEGECGHRHSAGRCPARHLARHPVTNSVVVLTVAHLDHTPEHCDPANLRAFCQRCPPVLRRGPACGHGRPHPREGCHRRHDPAV